MLIAVVNVVDMLDGDDATRWILTKYPCCNGVKSVQLNRATPWDLVKIHLIAVMIITTNRCRHHQTYL